ncbi:MAG: hypothetical protein IH986_10480 [Planctomycetes bacterium]|nr:hypothetical protein [Planctomycetota bacterium]
MHEFVSEWIQPRGGAFDTHAMGSGTPGLPRAFEWHGETIEVAETLAAWKESGPEVGRLHGERYLRRHYWRLRMADGSVWTVYFVRHTPRGGSAKRRWFLYNVKRGDSD